ncbi:MAG TPA: hypothetical protein VGT04_12175 [Acidobacteriaceae bacterium]|nr:hypothetical protein [Acidobacteriaceae bacterium]
MINESQIRQQLGRYLRGNISLDVFEDWLVQRSWNMHKDSDEAAQKLASQIELRLAEHSSGHLDEEAMREEFRAFITKFTMQIVFNGAPVAPVEPVRNLIAVADPQVMTFRAVVSPPSRAAIGFVDRSPEAVHG